MLADTDTLVGTMLGKDYRVLQPIGAGGMAIVYLVEHQTLLKRFAAKVLSPLLASSLEARARFAQEAHAASQLDHENIVSITDFGVTADHRPYFVMELLRGETLDQRLEAGPMSLEEVVAVSVPVARALAHAHAEGIVHLDVKPENIFLVQRSQGRWGVKVVDFGIARIPGNPRLTNPGEAVGSPMFMAPEVCCGADDVDQRADVYSFGILLYLMLCGRLPFVDDNLVRVLQMQLVELPPPPREVNRELSPELAAIVERALAKAPEDRYPSMQALLRDLDAALPLGADRLLIEAQSGTTLDETPFPRALSITRHDSHPRHDSAGSGASGVYGSLGSGGHPAQPRDMAPRPRTESPAPAESQQLPRTSLPVPPSGVIPSHPAVPRRSGVRLGIVIPVALVVGGVGGWVGWQQMNRTQPALAGAGGDGAAPAVVSNLAPTIASSAPAGDEAAGAALAAPAAAAPASVEASAAATGEVAQVAGGDRPEAPERVADPRVADEGVARTVDLDAQAAAALAAPAAAPDEQVAQVAAAPTAGKPQLRNPAAMRREPLRPPPRLVAAAVGARGNLRGGAGVTVAPAAPEAAVSDAAAPPVVPAPAAVVEAASPSGPASPGSEAPAAPAIAQAKPAVPAPAPVIAALPADTPPIAPTPAPVKAPTPAPVKATAPAPIKASPGTLDAVPEVTTLAVKGSLSPSIVKRSVERSLSSMRTCYQTAARAGSATPALELQLSFEIDENGRAAQVATSGARFGSLASCAADVASKIRTQVAPDVGTAQVTVGIRFRPS